MQNNPPKGYATFKSGRVTKGDLVSYENGPWEKAHGMIGSQIEYNSGWRACRQSMLFQPHDIKVIVGGGRTHNFDDFVRADKFARKKLIAFLFYKRNLHFYIKEYQSGKAKPSYKMTKVSETT